MSQINYSDALKGLYHSIGIAKGIHFTVQGAFLPLIERLATGEKKQTLLQFKEHIQGALVKMNRVIHQDSENIVRGFYPAEVLFQETPWSNFSRIPYLFSDAFRAARQKVKKKADMFNQKDSEFLSEVPEYYRRNFHFQKGGYLSDDSARLYDHQVEVLFSGTAQAMRRQIIPQMKEHFHHSDGEGLKFLEVGSGTGSLTRSLALAFPKAQIVGLDLSPHYLSYARKRLDTFRRVHFVQGQAEDLDFKDESFDAVISCYLFHELPESIRHQVIKEKIRVSKTAGFLGIIDSLQIDDDLELNWALEQFPMNFHEPFFKNYTQKKLEDVLGRYQVENVSSKIAFLTKIVSAVKKSPVSSND